MNTIDKSQKSEINLRNTQAKFYDNIFFSTRGKYWTNAQIKLVLKYLNLNNNQFILDAGCGTGIYSTEILKFKKNLNIDAIDFSESELDIFKNKLNSAEKEKVNIYNSDLVNFNFSESKYDRILLIEILQHIPSEEKRKQIISKLYKALKNGGLILSLNYLWGGFIKQPQLKEDFNFNNSGLYRFAFDNKDLKDLFIDSGFSKVKNIKLIRSPHFFQKFFPHKLSYFIERNLVLFGLFETKAKYILTLGYK